MSDPAADSARDPVEIIVEGTHRLNSLVLIVDEITAQLHGRHPVSGQIIPGPTRRAVGDTPELLTRASAKVAEAVLAASMARTELRAARPIDVDLVEMYDALLAISGASQDMYRVLMETNWWNRVFRDDASGHFVRLPDRPNEGIDYYHTLFALPDVLWEHADERNVNGDDADLDGLLFDATPPEGGTPVEEMSIDYPEYGPRQIWRFDITGNGQAVQIATGPASASNDGAHCINNSTG